MKKYFLPLLLLGLLYTVPAQGEDIGNDNLTITLLQINQGLELAGIRQHNTEILDDSSSLFSLSLQQLSDNATTDVTSIDAWEQINTSSDGDNTTIVFSNSEDPNLPDSLTVTTTISVSGSRSQWDLAVTGVGNNHTLRDVTFPEMNIRAEGNDQFLIPKYSGTLIPNPVAENIDRELYYPRGWSATMQFLAYYNDAYGVYLGFHDPKASLKRFFIKAANGQLNFQGKVAVADKTLGGNDWDLEGHFELDLFQGDWFEAALIYKNWAADKAEYWPKMTRERKLRQAELGKIGIWGYYAEPVSTSMDEMETGMSSFINFFQTDLVVPVGIHWYRWNLKDFDDDYPNYFPERTGMSTLVDHIQQSGNAYIMPYINGRLYDTDLTGEWDYQTKGNPYATKKSDGSIYTQDFNGNTFAVMCPTQRNWQNYVIDAAEQLTNRIGTGGIYIDQVSAAGPIECMDSTHNHPLGGGSWWRTGYRDMFAGIRDAIELGRFVVVEGGADYMADQVDGFLTEGWLTNNLVPAFQAIYSGRVQLVGKKTGTSRYGNQSFYCKLSQAFVQGIQPGRLSSWIVLDDRPDGHAEIARPFIKKIAAMRYKLRDFLSFALCSSRCRLKALCRISPQAGPITELLLKSPYRQSKQVSTEM